MADHGLGLPAVVAAGRRLRLLYDAGTGIGTTLDMARTAEALARAAVPRLADFVTVDLAEPVLRGEEPAGGAAGMRRVAVAGIREVPAFYARGELIRFAPSTPQAQGYGTGRAVLEADLADAPGWQAQDPERSRGIVAEGVHSLITAPLRARGIVLGVVNFWRSEKPEPFDADDLSLAEELVARAAVAVDNARRYTREHTMAAGPVRVRLLRMERSLVCEVSDASSTSPHLRRAATTDEGGRGLFLVARLSERWGTRYTGTGKVIWAEQRLPPA